VTVVGVRTGSRPQDAKVVGADGSSTRKKKWRHLLETHPCAGASGGTSCRELPHPTALRQPPLRRTVPAMVGALPRRPSADHSREGTSTASILAGPAVSRRRSSPRPRSPHCCRCCDEAPIAAVVVPAPFPLSSFLSVPLLLILALSLACSRTRVLSPSPASLDPSRECSLLSFFLSLSFLARSSPTHACSPSLSLSLRARASPLACVLSFSLSLTLAPSRSRRNAGSAHFTRSAMSRAANPVSPFRPFRRPSLRISSRPPRHIASLPGPAGYHPP